MISFCLLTLQSSKKWRSPLFGATCNFNDQILPYLFFVVLTYFFNLQGRRGRDRMVVGFITIYAISA